MTAYELAEELYKGPNLTVVVPKNNRKSSLEEVKITLQISGEETQYIALFGKTYVNEVDKFKKNRGF